MTHSDEDIATHSDEGVPLTHSDEISATQSEEVVSLTPFDEVPQTHSDEEDIFLMKSRRPILMRKSLTFHSDEVSLFHSDEVHSTYPDGGVTSIHFYDDSSTSLMIESL